MSNIRNTLKPSAYYESDVQELKSKIPLLQSYSDKDVELLYEAYSDTYSAGWLMVDEESIADFSSWLEH